MKFLTTREVAKYIGLSEGRVRELAQAGNIKALRPLGRKGWMFPPNAVAEYLGIKSLGEIL